MLDDTDYATKFKAYVKTLQDSMDTESPELFERLNSVAMNVFVPDPTDPTKPQSFNLHVAGIVHTLIALGVPDSPELLLGAYLGSLISISEGVSYGLEKSKGFGNYNPSLN